MAGVSAFAASLVAGASAQQQQQQQQRGVDVGGPVMRLAGGRRPFLVKKRTVESEMRQGERDEEDSASWWEANASRVREWLRSNPLHLGMEDEGVAVVQQMLRSLERPNTTEARRRKSWEHIALELEGVPGNPLSESTIVAPPELSLEPQRHDQPEEPAIPEAGPETRNQEQAIREPEIATPIAEHNNDVDETTVPPALEPIDIKDVNESDAQAESQPAAPATGSARSSARSANSAKTTTKTAKPSKPNFRPAGKLERRKTDSDIGRRGKQSSKIKAAASALLTKDPMPPLTKRLTSMSLIERQEYLLGRKKERERRLRLQQEEKETEECTHKPSSFTDANNFSEVESVIKRNPSATWSESPNKSKHQASSPNKLLWSDSSSSIGISVDAETTPIAKAADSRAGSVQPAESAKAESDKPVVRRRNSVPRRKSRFKLLEQAAGTSQLLNACKQDLVSSKDSTKEANDELLASETGDAAATIEEAATKDAQAAQLQREPSEADMAHFLRESRIGSGKSYKFADNSTAEKGKIQVQEYGEFQLDSFYRKRDRGSAKPGVSLLMGRREDDFTEQVVAVVFDRSKFSEQEASDWMSHNIHRFPTGRRELIKKLRS